MERMGPLTSGLSLSDTVTCNLVTFLAKKKFTSLPFSGQLKHVNVDMDNGTMDLYMSMESGQDTDMDMNRKLTRT